MSKIEVESFISNVLRELSIQEGVPVPKWTWRVLLGIAMFNKRTKVIEIREFTVLNAWRKDAERTKRYLRHVLAHEFYHYLVEIGKASVKPRLLIERDCDLYAMKYSGLSESEISELKRRPLTPDFVEEWR